MTFYNRNGILYVSISGIRKSTKLKYNQNNIKKFKSYYQNEEFLNHFNFNKNIPFVLELVDEVLLQKEKEIKSSSLTTYYSLYNSIIEPYFKNKYIVDIKPIDVYNFYKTFTDKSTLTTCNSILKAAFEKAIIHGYIKNSPFTISKPKIKSNYKIDPFTFDEAKTIINNSPGVIKNLIAFCFYTGVRSGEAFGLKWENVDFNNYRITIDSQITRGIETTPKTVSSIRTIDMLKQCEYYLKEQYKHTSNSKYVFLSIKNKPYCSTGTFSHIWKNILLQLGIKYRPFYHTRHSFASNMLSNGENALWVSKMLGHKSLNITLTNYSKYIKISDTRKSTYLDN